MSDNVFGRLFRFATWGESHGPMIGCVVDGAPSRIALSEADIQPYLDARRPGGSRFVSQRREMDRAQIVSGVFEGQTTGAPISTIIHNEDTRSRDYQNIAQAFRPGHADYSWFAKYGIRDWRGGGRSSARETAARVIAGAIARKVVPAMRIRAAVVEMAGDAINPAAWDWDEVARNPFFCPDAAAAARWETLIDQARKDGSSRGAIVEVLAEGVPVGLGAPHYGRLDADLAGALMSIHAVKGVEIGDGFAAARMRGEDSNDAMRMRDGVPEFLSNHAGGVLGGVSTGQPLRARVAIKPTSSIRTPQRSINEDGNNAEVATTGRHDPCVGLRAAPVVEAMVACVLADHWLRAKAIKPETP